jgi:lysophospholipase L1-like esterase
MLALSKKKKFTIVAISMSMGILLLLGEFGVRLFVENGDITPEILRKRSVQYEPVIFARHAFKQEARIVNNPFGKKKELVWEINEKGYRGHNFDVPKPKGMTRIMVFGGSSVFDTKSTQGEDWPHRVEEKLRKSGYANVEVINAGVIGHTALESVGRLFAEGFVFDPDYVLIYNAWNDIKYFSSSKTVLRTLQPSLQGFDPRIHNGTVLDRWLCEWSQLYTVLRRIYYKTKMKIGNEGLREAEDKQNSTASLNSNGFRQYQLAMEMFVDLARNIGAKPFLMTQARLVAVGQVLTPERTKRVDYHHVGLSHDALVETFDRLDGIVRNVSATKGSKLIDASAHLSGKDWAFDDHVHVVPKGSDALAQLVAEHLQAELRRRE